MPADPTSFAAVIYAAGVSLSWVASVGADGYKLYRRPNGVGASYLFILDTDQVTAFDWVPNFDMSDLDAGAVLTVYDYKVTAYDSSSESSGSTLTATMVDINGTNVTNFDIDHPTYNDGSDKVASYTITNTNLITPTIDDSARSFFENRLRGVERFKDD